MSNKILIELSKQDARWRNVAFNLCGDKELADDLVQDMYLKAANLEYVKAGWVYRVLYNLFIDYCRERKHVRIEEHNYLECKDKAFEPTDYEQELLNRFEELYWTDQDLIRESYDRSMREIQKAYPMIHYGYAYRQINKSIRLILGDDFDKYVNNNDPHKNLNK